MAPEATENGTINYDRNNGTSPRTATDLNAQQGGMTPFADRLLETGTPEHVDEMVSGETNEDHVLGNLKDEELWERRFNIMNNEEFLLAMFPPQESVLQGELREEFGLDGPKHAAPPTVEHELSDTADAAYARSTRSRGGWQQEMLAKSITEMHRVDGEMDDDDDGGLLGGILGGGS